MDAEDAEVNITYPNPSLKGRDFLVGRGGMWNLS
jgi:hypothetical protein